jgi:hypothetical protein
MERKLQYERSLVQKLTLDYRVLELEHRSTAINLDNTQKKSAALKAEIDRLKKQKQDLESQHAELLRPFTPRPDWDAVLASYRDLHAYARLFC